MIPMYISSYVYKFYEYHGMFLHYIVVNKVVMMIDLYIGIKYAACRYLNMSRATFDNYVRTGKLPKGKHEIGFKELSYSKKDLDEFIKKYKQS